jgi:glycosyltransferase involved in cell wall biosynthesis
LKQWCKKYLDLRQRIHFEGFRPEPQRYMLATDIFVLASHYESFGLVLIEAREAGVQLLPAM